MNQSYYDAVTKMEGMNVNEEYIQGWQAGFLQNPKREEQRVTEAYEAGYTDGEEKSSDNFSNWTWISTLTWFVVWFKTPLRRGFALLTGS